MFQIGKKVKIVGLKSEAGKKVNGLIGIIKKKIEETGRMVVEITLKNEDESETKSWKSIKLENLEPAENLMEEIKEKLIENSNKKTEEEAMMCLINFVIGDHFAAIIENPQVIADVVVFFLKERNHNAAKNLVMTLKHAYEPIFVKSLPLIEKTIGEDADTLTFFFTDHHFATIWEGVEINFE